MILQILIHKKVRSSMIIKKLLVIALFSFSSPIILAMEFDVPESHNIGQIPQMSQNSSMPLVDIFSHSQDSDSMHAEESLPFPINPINDSSSSSSSSSSSPALPQARQQKSKKNKPDSNLTDSDYEFSDDEKVAKSTYDKVNRKKCPTCKKLIKKNCFAVHERIHKKIKPFSCPQGDYQGVQKHHTTGHIIMHHMKNKPTCEICKIKITDIHDQKEHAKSHVIRRNRLLSKPDLTKKQAQRR